MGKAGSGELVQGTLPLLILRTLATGPNHGFAIARRIQQVSNDVLKVEEGSLYPALHRLEVQGWIDVGVARHREQPQREVLPPDARGTEATGTRGGALECDRRRDCGGAS